MKSIKREETQPQEVPVGPRSPCHNASVETAMIHHTDMISRRLIGQVNCCMKCGKPYRNPTIWRSQNPPSNYMDLWPFLKNRENRRWMFDSMMDGDIVIPAVNEMGIKWTAAEYRAALGQLDLKIESQKSHA